MVVSSTVTRGVVQSSPATSMENTGPTGPKLMPVMVVSPPWVGVEVALVTTGAEYEKVAKGKVSLSCVLWDEKQRELNDIIQARKTYKRQNHAGTDDAPFFIKTFENELSLRKSTLGANEQCSSYIV
jgi:hypothetical protein